MPKYSYMARDASGTAVQGDIIAGTEIDAARLLRTEGKFVVNLKPASEYDEAAMTALVHKGCSKVKTDEIIYFANQLAGMVDTGVPLADALESTIDQAPPGAYRRTIEDIIQRVQSGADLSAALAAHTKVFGPVFVHLVRASETTGMMGAMLNRVADYLGEQRELRKKIKGALLYPCCMLTFAAGATIFLLTFVLPKFAAIYGNKSAVLPLPTRILMGSSTWLVSNWYYVLAGLVVAIVGLILFFRTERGKYTGDWLRLNTPVVGNMYHKACLARSLRTLGTMITAGVSVLDAIRIAEDVVQNRLFAKVFQRTYSRLERGDQLSHALLNAPYFPRPIWQMISAGERTGQLGPVMDRVSNICDSDLRHAIRTMTQFIEPALILVMGVVIGGIALAVLLPIFQISKVMAQ